MEAASREPVLLAEVLAGASAALRHADRTGTAVPDVRDPARTPCRRCGIPAAWHRTVHGRWILMEPGDFPVGHVPAGKRWRIAGDGTAVALGRAEPADSCRVSHFDVCPAAEAPAESLTLLSLWWRNSRHRSRS
ncbi:DUF6083 domain-containing protein [Streptomyces bambusae]|uniref:DUF6083 domain-containing protein n=1 Tax=Streptomyces bambusae TaxID=1550616 RepID=UPI001CFFA2C0|nr:DUF6083 domain-containing protein [Streptomyces bambusae]MCB5170236.1 DUF6083 domain-containing protein [Streptomyces bambusae]